MTDDLVTTEPPAPTVSRQTWQRAAIREVVAAGDDFRTAQQVHDDLRYAGQQVGLATVYRTLTSMTEAGELDGVRSPDGEMTYRRCSRDHHHHLICRSCGRAVEFSSREVEALVGEVAAQHGFRDVGHELEIYGACDSC